MLGYVGIDDEGLAGIESSYDKLLKGEAGTVLIQMTSSATCSPGSSSRRRPGASLGLTIDEYLQHIAERELRAGVEENHAAGRQRHHHGPVDR